MAQPQADAGDRQAPEELAARRKDDEGVELVGTGTKAERRADGCIP